MNIKYLSVNVKSFYLIMVIFFFSFLTNEVLAQFPEYQEIHGEYTNEEFGFGFVLPESLNGFLYENDNPAVGKILNIQVHHEMNPEEGCCPIIPSSRANILFESHPDPFYSTPVPFTGDIFAAFQAYNMNVKIDTIGEYQILSSTLDFDKADLGFPDAEKTIGKSYFFNTGDRYISYGILASEEHYDKHIEKFEESARSIAIENSTSIDLDEIFLITYFYASKLTPDSPMLPKIQTPSIIDSVHLDESSNTVQVRITEPNSFRSFFAINIGELLEGPYAVTWDGDPIDMQILETDLQKYLVMFYFGEGPHEIIISGSPLAKDTQMNPTSQTLNSPTQQFQSGIAIDKIQCKEHFVLVAKNDGTPACVKPETKEKLVERGWATCDDTISYNTEHQCRARSSDTISFDLENYKEQSIVIIPKGAVIAENEHLIPKEITVILGKNNTVTWINQDDTGHGIASDKGGKDAWGSPGILKPGESFSVTFNSTGSYGYHGQPGPWRTGTVIVIDGMDTASLDKMTCESQIHTNKPPEIYNVTPTDDGAIVRWYQTPQTINAEHCGFPEKYKIFVGLASPIIPPFKFTDEIIHGGFRGDYKITGLESNTTYYVDIKGDWGTKIISSKIDMSFTTLNPGETPHANNPIEKARDTISGNFTLQK